MIFLLFTTLALAFAQFPPDPAQVTGFENDVRCLLDLDIPACETKVSIDGSRDSDFFYLESPCSEKNHPDSCGKLGKWYAAHKQPEKADPLFEKSCQGKSTIGCWHILQKHIEKLGERLANDAMAATIQEAKSAYEKICDDPKLVGQCQLLASKLGDGKKALEFKSCELMYDLIQTENRVPEHRAMKQEFPSAEEECRLFCKKSFEGLKLDGNTLRVRGQCLFDAKPSGNPAWTLGKADSNCRAESIKVGEAVHYRLCFCEQQNHDLLNEAGAPFGIYAGAETSRVKNLGKEKWYRCAAGFHYADPTAARKDSAQCSRNLQAFKDKAQALKDKGDIDLNFDHLKCGADQGAKQ